MKFVEQVAGGLEQLPYNEMVMELHTYRFGETFCKQVVSALNQRNRPAVMYMATPHIHRDGAEGTP